MLSAEFVLFGIEKRRRMALRCAATTRYRFSNLHNRVPSEQLVLRARHFEFIDLWDQNGPAFHAAAGDGPLEKRVTKETYQLHNASMADLAEFINTIGDRFVVDKTGLQGRYDFDLKLYDLSVIVDFKRSVVDSLVASLPSALQSLGLKLEAQKAQVEFMIVDSIQRPSEN